MKSPNTRGSLLRRELLQGLDAFEIDEALLPYFDRFGDKGRRLLLALAGMSGYEPVHHRSRAVYVLGELGWRPAFPRLARLLDDPVPSIRFNAIYACARTGGPNAIGPLLELALDEERDQSERIHALRPLAQIGDLQVVQQLEKWPCEGLPPDLARQRRDTLGRLRDGLREREC
jgi:hypothetical protein